MRCQLQDASPYETRVWVTVAVSAVLGGAAWGFFHSRGWWAPVLAALIVTPGLNTLSRVFGLLWATLMLAFLTHAPGATPDGWLLAGFALIGLVYTGLCAQAAKHVYSRSQLALSAALGLASFALAPRVFDSVAQLLTSAGAGGTVARALACAGAGVVAALAPLPLYLRIDFDRVRAAAAKLTDTLSEQPSAACQRLLSLYAQCRARLEELPADARSSQFRSTFTALSLAGLAQIERWEALAAELRTRRAAPTAKDVERLMKQLSSTRDAIAKAHLEHAVAALSHEQAQLAELEIAGERGASQLEAVLASMQQALSALSALRHGRTELRWAELTALSRQMANLSAAQTMEGEVMREVAEGAQLDQLQA